MEQVYKFNLDNYIQYYDYGLCDEQSDDEYSDNEGDVDKEHHVDRQCEALTSETTNPLSSSKSGSSEKEKFPNTKPFSSRGGKLPKSIKDCLDGFSEKFAKANSF